MSLIMFLTTSPFGGRVPAIYNYAGHAMHVGQVQAKTYVDAQLQITEKESFAKTLSKREGKQPSKFGWGYCSSCTWYERSVLKCILMSSSTLSCGKLIKNPIQSSDWIWFILIEACMIMNTESSPNICKQHNSPSLLARRYSVPAFFFLSDAPMSFRGV